MRHLVNISVYAFNKSYDYQSVCDPGAAPKQGAGHRSAYVVSKTCDWALSSHGTTCAGVDHHNEFLTCMFYFIAIDCRHSADWLVGHSCCLVSQGFCSNINKRKLPLNCGLGNRWLALWLLFFPMNMLEILLVSEWSWETYFSIWRHW